MTSWLDVLRAALPPSGVLLVGAGAGDGPWMQWLLNRSVASEHVPVLLVEGDEQQYRHLQQSLAAHAGWALRRDVVTASSGRATFHRASNPAESGLLEPETLQQLWPHLSTEHSIVIEDAVTLDALKLEIEGEFNWLLLDCLPAASLLRGGAQLLAGLDVALVRVATADAGNCLPTDLLAGEQAADELLRAAGLRCIHTQPERHPALAHALYVHDTARRALEQKAWAKEKAELTHAREAAGEKVHAAERAKALAEEQARALGEQLKAGQEAWAKEKAELTQAREMAGRKVRAAEQAKAVALEQAQKLSEQLKVAQEAWAREKAELTHARETAEQKAQTAEQAQASVQAQRLQDQQLESYRQSIKHLEKELRANFGKDLGNAVKQIEDFISIQNYLNVGFSISGFHGWPISPDIGLFLIERIRERHYDLIIEFGSGTSTALFAKVLQIEQRAAASKALSAGDDLAQRICSFEHDPIYLRKTRDMLAFHGLTDMVSLNHSPLLDWQDDTGRYLHYDCDATLASLAQQLADSPKRLLVLVDGPPGTTCANARYPAVPKIFKHFARHEIDVVLDDAYRTEEKAVIDLWRTFWKQRSMRVKDSILQSEKGLFWARNYDE